MNAVCVLASGGLDSAALIGDLSRGRTVYPVYIRQGLAWEKAELYWLRRFLKAVRGPRVKPLQVFALPMGDVYGRHWSMGRRRVPGAHSPDQAVYLPGRNPLLTVKAAVFCALHKIPALAVGSLNHNPFPDAAPAFFKVWSQALSRALGRKIQVLTPFRPLSKVQVIRRARQWPLELSFSCLAPRGLRHCGRCNKCAERQKAFRQAGVKDKTRYAD